jgi:hypothetical protein
LTHPLDLLRAKECIVASDVLMLESVERATSASVFRSSGSNVRRDFAGRLTHARFRVRMIDVTGAMSGMQWHWLSRGAAGATGSQNLSCSE